MILITIVFLLMKCLVINPCDVSFMSVTAINISETFKHVTFKHNLRLRDILPPVARNSNYTCVELAFNHC